MIPVIFKGLENHIGFWVRGYDDDVLQWISENKITYTQDRLRTQFGYFDTIEVFTESDYMALKLKWS